MSRAVVGCPQPEPDDQADDVLPAWEMLAYIGRRQSPCWRLDRDGHGLYRTQFSGRGPRFFVSMQLAMATCP